MKNIEHLAAEYSGDPERILPPVGKLESATSYQNKKVKPIFEKVVQLLRSVYHAYLDLKSKFDRLESAHKREIAKKIPCPSESMSSVMSVTNFLMK